MPFCRIRCLEIQSKLYLTCQTEANHSKNMRSITARYFTWLTLLNSNGHNIDTSDLTKPAVPRARIMSIAQKFRTLRYRTWRTQLSRLRYTQLRHSAPNPTGLTHFCCQPLPAEHQGHQSIPTVPYHAFASLTGPAGTCTTADGPDRAYPNRACLDVPHDAMLRLAFPASP